MQLRKEAWNNLVPRVSPLPFPSSLAPGEGKRRDPGNEVEPEKVAYFSKTLQELKIAYISRAVRFEVHAVSRIKIFCHQILLLNKLRRSS